MKAVYSFLFVFLGLNTFAQDSLLDELDNISDSLNIEEGDTLQESSKKKENIIKDGDNLVEPTSGNTGLALAMIGNLSGYKLTTPMSNKIPLPKRALLAFEGSEVLELDDELCPAPGAPEGAIARAKALGETPSYTMLNQYANPDNPGTHYKTTGPEIWKQTDGKVTHIVAGLGTCGTINGILD